MAGQRASRRRMRSESGSSGSTRTARPSSAALSQQYDGVGVVISRRRLRIVAALLAGLPAATGSRLSAVSSFDAGVIVRTDVSTWTYASGPGGEMNRRMANCPDPGDHRRARLKCTTGTPLGSGTP